MLRSALVTLAGLALITACAKENDTPAATPATQYPQPVAGQPVAQPVAQQPAVVAAPAPVAAAPVAAPATGTMATPNAFALPCTSDASCGFARCNVQFSKCAFPCQSAVDCAANAACNTTTGLCLPGAPQ